MIFWDTLNQHLGSWTLLCWYGNSCFLAVVPLSSLATDESLICWWSEIYPCAYSFRKMLIWANVFCFVKLFKLFFFIVVSYRCSKQLCWSLSLLKCCSMISYCNKLEMREGSKLCLVLLIRVSNLRFIALRDLQLCFLLICSFQ